MAQQMSQIKHVVHLMLENRSLDNVLGWLYEDTGNVPAVNLIDTQAPPAYYGLTNDMYNLSSPEPGATKEYVSKAPDNNLAIPAFDPYEIFQHVKKQVYTSLTTGQYPSGPEMGGFYQDYATDFDSPQDIMMAFTPQNLPVINGLAKNFAVCDRWFSSVPTQTFCNRAFAATGNSEGKDWLTGATLQYLDNSQFLEFTSNTHWNVLSNNGKDKPTDWMIYYSQLFWLREYCLTRDLFKELKDSSLDANFASIDSFYTAAANGSLPSYSFLEPDWGLMYWKLGIDGTDYHPPGNVGKGEVFLQQVYDAVSQGPAWNETLLIITFDEHGGTYDHYPINTNAQAPGNVSSAPEYPFDFKTFGVRVPAILVSPWVPQGAVFRMPDGETPFDHTSVIATVLDWMGIDRSLWNLGNRVAAAPTLDPVLCNETPRTDVPIIQAAPYTSSATPPPVSDLHKLIVARAWRYAAEKNNPSII
ncbi:alkaline phosphatase family protein [Chitinophaga sp. Hz27]|uniref:alkaline phosphatase family protein n=1 Tax=Chitinophaga sp. Hz27 TaxID=3347169 RepID=UPI0035DAC028